MSPTTEIHNGLFNRSALHCPIAVLAALLMVAMSCQSLFAQAPTPGKRAAPPRRQDRRAVPVVPVEPEAEDAEEEEETPPAHVYKELPVDDSLKKDGSKVTPFLTAGVFANPADQTMFDDYYRNYLLARWSLVDNIENLPKERKDLCNHLGKRSVGGPAVHDHLNDIVLEVMKTLASGDFHPAVRYNAVLMIGDLNSVEKTVGQDKDVPLSDALKVLMGAAESGKLADELRVAAMIGITRHARLGIQDEDVRASLAKSMLRLATTDIPAGAAAGGRAWIRAQAIEILGVLGSVGENNAVLQALLKTVADDKLPPFVRIAAVDALGELNYASANGGNAAEAAATICQYALDACTEELQAAKKPSSVIVRRRLMSSLVAVLSALGGEGEDRKGVASLAKEPNQQAAVADLQKTIEDACKTFDQTSEDKELKTPVADLQKKLKAWLQKKPK